MGEGDRNNTKENGKQMQKRETKKHGPKHSPSLLSADAGAIRRSEGEAERDIGSPCMIGQGLVVVEKFFRRRRRRRRRHHLGVDPKKLGFCIKNIE